MSTNNSREILACRLQVLSRKQREGERQRARVNRRRASEDDRQRERVRSRRRRQNFSEESRQVERVRARGRRENRSEKRRQAEWDRARMNRQRQREREIQRQKERQQNNDMMTESVVLMLLWPRAINILISNWSRTRKFSQSFENTSRRRLFTFLTIVTRSSRSTTVQFLCSDWSKFDRWVHAENLYSILNLVYFDSWRWQSFLSTYDAFYCLFHWMHKMKYSCYQQSSVIHGWFVYWIFGWEMRRSSKLEIRFRMTSF